MSQCNADRALPPADVIPRPKPSTTVNASSAIICRIKTARTFIECSPIGIIPFLLSLPITQYGSAADADNTTILGHDEAIYFVVFSQDAEPLSSATSPCAKAVDFSQGFPRAEGAATLPMATVDFHEETAQVHRAYVAGSALASISRDTILSSDGDEVLQKVRSVLQNMRGIIRNFASYDLYVDLMRFEDAANEGASPHTIRIEQRIDDFEARYRQIQVGADNEVKVVTFTPVNPEQEGQTLPTGCPMLKSRRGHWPRFARI